MSAVFPHCYSFSVASTTLTPADKVTTLGVILDSKLSFDAQVSAVCKNAHFHLRALRHIRSSLTNDMATSVAVALIHSRLDYANSLLYCISDSHILNYSVARTRPPALFYNNHPLTLFMISLTDFTGYLSGPESTLKSPNSPTIPSHLVIRHTFAN